MSKAFVVMLGAAAVLGVGAWYVQGSKAAATSVDRAGELFPELGVQVNDVTAFSIATPEDELRFERRDGKWVAADRGGYPADGAKIGQYLLALKNSERVEQKTSNPENYESLGLDPEAENATTAKVTASVAGAPVAELFVGNRRTRGSDEAYYVRVEGEPACWIASGSLRVDSQLGAWIQKDLIDIPRDELVAARIDHPDGESIILANSADPEAAPTANMELINVPQGKELQSEWVTSRFGSALARLTLESVESAADYEWNADEAVKSSFWTEDGMRVDVHTLEVDDKLHTKISAAYDPTGVPQSYAGPLAADAPPPLSLEVEDDGEALADPSTADDEPVEEPKSPEDVQAEVAELNEKHADWIYVLPSWKKTALRARMDELVKDPTPEKAATPTLEDGVLTVPGAGLEGGGAQLEELIEQGGEELGETIEEAAEAAAQELEAEGAGKLEEAKSEAQQAAENVQGGGEESVEKAKSSIQEALEKAKEKASGGG